MERLVASAAYSSSGSPAVPWAPSSRWKLAEHVGLHAPFWFGAVAVAIGVVIVALGTPTIRRALHDAMPAHGSEAEAEAEAGGDQA